jgi:hypothetical protein
MVISNRGFCVLSFLCRGREENVEKNEDPVDLEDFGLKVGKSTSGGGQDSGFSISDYGSCFNLKCFFYLKIY